MINILWINILRCRSWGEIQDSLRDLCSVTFSTRAGRMGDGLKLPYGAILTPVNALFLWLFPHVFHALCENR